MVSGKLDLTPVIHLLNALSAGDREPTPQTQLQKIHPAPSRPSLGDFSPLWSFIGYEPLEPISRVSRTNSPLTLPAPSSLPSSDSSEAAVVVQGSPKKKKKAGKSSQVTAAFYVQKLPAARSKSSLRSSISDPNLKQSRLSSSSPGKKGRNGTSGKSQAVAPIQPMNWNDRAPITSTDPFHVRKTNLIKKLLVDFPSDASTIVPSLPVAKELIQRDILQSGIHIFIDNSNIVVGFLDAIKYHRGYHKNQRIVRPPFSFHNLSLILERGRPAARRILVGSVSCNADETIIEEARALKYDCNILQRVEVDVDGNGTSYKRRAPRKNNTNNTGDGSSSGSDSPTKAARTRWKEQAVDELLNLKMMETLVDYHVQPSTLVLASGDGAVGEFSDGFFKVVVRALERGWKVELVSFAAGMSSSYTNRDFMKRWRGQFSITCLDQYVEELLG